MRAPVGVPRALLGFMRLGDAMVLAKVSSQWRQFVLSNLKSEILSRASTYEVAPNDRRLVWWALLTRRKPNPTIFQTEELFTQGYVQGCAYTPDLGQIRKDICRTNFGIDPAVLEAVLVTTLFKAPYPVPYCQGMNFTAAFFLRVFSRPRRAAHAWYNWLFHAGEITRFDRDFRSVRGECAQIDAYCEKKCPRLKKLISVHRIELRLFTFNWLLLHYVYELHDNHFDMLLALWDHFILHGNSFLFKSILLLLNKTESKPFRAHRTRVCTGAIDRENWFELDEAVIMARLKRKQSLSAGGNTHLTLPTALVGLPQTYFGRYSRPSSLVRDIVIIKDDISPRRTPVPSSQSPPLLNRQSYCFSLSYHDPSSSAMSTPNEVAEEWLGRGVSPASRLRYLCKPARLTNQFE